MSRISVLVILILIVGSASVFPCSETANPFTMSQSKSAGRVLAKEGEEANYVVLPVPPEILKISETGIQTGWEFDVTAAFFAQKKITSLGFSPVEMPLADRSKRKVLLFLITHDAEYGNVQKRYEMNCVSGCADNTSQWRYVVPFDELPKPGETVGYFTAVKDEFGNVASEVPGILQQMGMKSYPSYVEKKGEDPIWSFIQRYGYSTPRLDDETEYTISDSVDSSMPKADIIGFRAAVSSESIFVDISFEGIPYPLFTQQDESLYFYSLNVFSSGANKNGVFDGKGQMIMNMTFPKINEYVDCGFLLTANIGSCYLQSSTEDMIMSSECSVDRSYSFSSGNISSYYYYYNIGFQFKKSVFNNATRDNFPEEKDLQRW